MNSWRRDAHGTGVLAMTTLSDVEWGPVQIDRSLEGAAHVPVLTGDRRQRVDSLFLAVDLGGTHARVGLVAAGDAAEPPVILAYETYRCVAYPSLSDILSSFRRTHHVHSCALVLACAGYMEQGAVINDNLAWPVIPEILRIEGGFTTVAVLNDFEAFAHAIGHIDRQHMTMIAEGISDPHGPIAVVGPGTGLGAALWLPGTPVRVLHSEAGQMELAARPGVEQAIRAELGPEDGYVAYEHVLSGPGLLRLYRALGVVRGCSTPCPTRARSARRHSRARTLSPWKRWIFLPLARRILRRRCRGVRCQWWRLPGRRISRAAGERAAGRILYGTVSGQGRDALVSDEHAGIRRRTRTARGSGRRDLAIAQVMRCPPMTEVQALLLHPAQTDVFCAGFFSGTVIFTRRNARR